VRRPLTDVFTPEALAKFDLCFRETLTAKRDSDPRAGAAQHPYQPVQRFLADYGIRIRPADAVFFQQAISTKKKEWLLSGKQQVCCRTKVRVDLPGTQGQRMR